MLSLGITVPLPLVLFVITLALVVVGFCRVKESTTRMAWVGIGFCEITLALLCFVAISGLYTSPVITEFAVPLAFSFISLLIMSGSSLLLIKGKI